MIILWIAIPILTTLNQLLLKLTAASLGDVPFGIEWIKMALSNPTIIGILLCEIASFIIWMKILERHDVSKAFPISGINYVLILFCGWFFFHEPIMPLQLIGSAMIIGGVFLIGSAPSGENKSRNDTQAL